MGDVTVVNKACTVAVQLVIVSVNCFLAGGIFMQGGGGEREGGQTETDSEG